MKTDIRLVCAGISGAMIAEALTDHGPSVVMVDRRGPMPGSTPGTTALVQNELDAPLSLLSRQIGKDRACSAWRRSRLAVAALKARIQECDIR